jgi:hypothetical protein
MVELGDYLSQRQNSVLEYELENFFALGERNRCIILSDAEFGAWTNGSNLTGGGGTRRERNEF